MKCGCRIRRQQSIPSLIKCLPECSSGEQVKQVYGERIIEKGIRMMELLYPNILTLQKPVCSFEEFIKSLVSMTRTAYSVYLLALYYMVRMASPLNTHSLPSPLSPSLESDPYHRVLLCKRRVFLGCLMAASKFVNEKNLTNTSWAKLSKLSVKEVCAIERHVLSSLDYRLYIPVDLYFKWHRALIRKDPGQVIKMFQSSPSLAKSSSDTYRPSLHVIIPSAPLVA